MVLVSDIIRHAEDLFGIEPVCEKGTPPAAIFAVSDDMLAVDD